MKLLYIANIRLPTEKAHGVQIMEMVGAFSKVGVDIELIVPKRNNLIVEDPFTYYRIPKTFQIRYLPSLDFVRFGRFGFLVQALTFMVAALWYTRKQDALIYSRDELFLSALSFFHKPYVFEVHAAKSHAVMRRAISKAQLIISISLGIKKFYEQCDVSCPQITVSPDGVNLTRFNILETREECRIKLSLPKDKRIALYSGHLYERKGAHILAEAAKSLPSDVLCVFVGGTAKDITEFTKRYGASENVIIVGHKPHDDIPYYLRAADVLVLPNSAKDDDARLYTSPMKLFEYMASGTPIIASDVSSVREVLDDSCAFFVQPDEPILLARLVGTVLEENNATIHVAEKALEKVKQYTWENRVKNILTFIQ